MILYEMVYKIIYNNSSLLKKDIDHIKKQPKIANLIKYKLEKFCIDPWWYIWDIKKLEPKSDNIYRIRIGNWRVILSIDTGNQIIIIDRIGQRKDIYK